MRPLIIFLIVLISASARADYILNDNIRATYDAIFNLKIRSARALVQKEIALRPENHYALYLDEYIDAVELIAVPSEERFERYKSNHERRREIMDRDDDSSPYYLAFKSEMSFLMGMFRMRYSERIAGFRNSLSGLKGTAKNLELHPGFKESLKLESFYNIGMANIPPFARWALAFFGIKVEKNTGIETLNKVLLAYQAEKEPELEAGTALIMIIGFKVNKEPELGYEFIKSLPNDIRGYRLINFFEANLAFRSGHNETALAILNRFDVGAVEMPFDHYNYMLGNIHLRKLDSKARGYFDKFLLNTEYKSYTKEVNYKIAESYLVENDLERFKIWKEKAEDTEGDDLVERDREATYDSELDYVPNPLLLRANLLISGGYLDRADKEILSYKANPGKRAIDKADFHLQYGRLLHLQGRRQEAIVELQKAIESNPDDDYQIAAEALVMLGRIYEPISLPEAKRYYTLAIENYEEEFYEVIESYAKRRLEVIGG